MISGGRVFARGGWGDPGIGAADYDKEAAPDIWITGGYVEAVGGQYASAIGGGYNGKYGSVTVSGGTVRATGGDSASDMIAGYGNQGGGDFTVTGGNIWLANDKANPAPKNAHGQAVYRVLVQSIDSTGAPVTIEGLGDYGTDDIYTHDGQIWLWLPNGVHTFAVNGTYYRAEVNDGPTRANWHLGHDTGVTINGREVAWLNGSGWSYHPDEKYVEMWSPNRSYVLSGTNTTGEVMFSIDVDAEVTLSNLCLKCTTTDACCIWATNNVNVTMYLAGTNTLDACGNDGADMGDGLGVANGTHLTVTNAEGFADADAVLVAKSGWGRAAIAVGRDGTEGEKPCFGISGGTIFANWENPETYAVGIGTSRLAGRDGGADIVISGGRVFARGGTGDPGIGAADSMNVDAPDIQIVGGYVEAIGGYRAAGIGGGWDGKYASVTVLGGTVRAEGGYDAPFDMLAGYQTKGGGDFTVTGGSIVLTRGLVNPVPMNALGQVVYCVTVEGLEGSVSLEGPAGYGTKDIVAVDGKICLWLPNGTHGFKVNGVDYYAVVDGANTTAQPGKVTGVTVNGVDVGFGSSPDWTYNAATHSVVITGKDGSYVLSGANTAGEVMFKIDVDASVTLSNLTLKCGGVACVQTANDVDVTLLLAGKNSLLGAPIYVGGYSRLVITNAPGFAEADAELTASVPSDFTRAAISLGSTSAYFEIAGGTVIASSMNSVAIGGDVKADIVISGGHVTAEGGGVGNPAIGGLKARANAPNIRITGGYVEAFSITRAAAIGGGEKGGHGSVEVSGGTVLAQCDSGASDMIAGAGDLGGGDFTVTGGSIYLYHGKANPAPSNGTDRVWCVTVPGVATDKPAIEGLPDGYGTKDVETINGKIYLWLPNGKLSSNYEYTFTVGGKTYKARVYNSNADAVEQPATPLAPGQSSLPYNTEAEARAAIAKHLVSFGPTDAVKTVLEASIILTVAGYKAMFAPVVYQAKEDGKWRVMYELTASATNTLMQSIHDVVTKIDLAEITAEGVASMFLEGGIPGFYYTLFASDAVTSVTEPSSRDKTNSDKLCDEEGVVTFLNVEKPSDAAGFFTVSVSPEQAFTSGEPLADARGGGIIVLPPVIATGSDD